MLAGQMLHVLVEGLKVYKGEVQSKQPTGVVAWPLAPAG